MLLKLFLIIWMTKLGSTKQKNCLGKEVLLVSFLLPMLKTHFLMKRDPMCLQ